MELVANYDLSQRISGEYQGNLEDLKSSINTSIDILNQIIQDSRQGSTQVNLNAAELSKSSQVIANGASQQAAGLGKISESMDNIGSQAKATNQNAKQALNLSTQVSK